MAKRRYSRKKSRKTKRRRRVGKRRSKIVGGARKAKFFSTLRQIKGLNSNQQSQALKMANNTFIRQLGSHVKQLRHAKLPPKVSKGLKRHARAIRKLISPKTSIRAKRNLLTQRGGFFPALLASLAAPFITSVVSGAFRRR